VPVRLGQFEGYRQVDGVADDSTTETYVDLTLEIDVERWRGVPWRLVTGKAMADTLTEIEVTLHPAEAPAFLDCRRPGPNRLWITLKPFEQIRLSAEVRAPGLEVRTRPAELTTTRDYRDGAAVSVDAYALLFDAARRGDREPFASIGSVLSSWSIVDPVLADPPELEIYPQGSEGPLTG
jgi:glucose-6-phosphate 1-dehydrogenase